MSPEMPPGASSSPPNLPRGVLATFSLDRLRPGVDNVRYDVWLSPDFLKATATLVRTMLAANLPVKNLPGLDTSVPVRDLKTGFAGYYQQVMLSALSLAGKQNKEPQIDFLAQLAICKMIKQEIQNQFASLVDVVNNQVWELESSKRRDPRDAMELKEALASFRQQKKSLIARTTAEVFQAKFSGTTDSLTNLRTSLFGNRQNIRPEELLLNPVLLADPDPLTDDLMLEEYILLGHRLSDGDRYDSLLELIRNLLQETAGTDTSKVDATLAERWLKQPEIIDHFFNAEKALDAGEAEARTKNLETCFSHFLKLDLIDRVVAAGEVKPIARNICPPVVPHQVISYLLVPASRKDIEKQAERYQKFFKRQISLLPLQELAKNLARIPLERKKEHLLSYLKGFIRYHRDYSNTLAVREVMERINLVSDEKIRDLSQANATLHEFLLPHEQTLDLGPGVVTGHVIIKADIRGATTISEHLLNRGLNPASYFSLNFFEPISRVVSAYGATKLFIEGDSIILAITEHENSDNMFGVSRACGLALSIVTIVSKNNAHGIKNNLPLLEVGCGISRRSGAPAYLFDGEHKIMISPAINRAAHLAGCAKNLRRLFGDRPRKFNLYVFADGPWNETIEPEGDDLFWRFNVNGIEIDQASFESLNREISLKKISCTVSDILATNHTLYAGTVPLQNGKFQRIIVREAEILEIKPDSLETAGPTGKKYYEICTSPALYEQIKKFA